MRFMVPLVLVAGVAQSQTIEGYYRPDQPWAESWSCDPDDLGMDGGALGIMNGKLYGLESACEIVSPTESNGGIRFEAVCSAEGETYRTDYFVQPTATGITLTRDGETVAWRRCEKQATSTGNVWVSGFAMGVTEASTSDGKGNSLTMSCQDGMNGQIYLTLDGQPAMGDVRFDVDGQSFELSSWAERGRLNVECKACADNYMALWEALRAGSQVTITAANRQATLSLDGSADALSPEPCVPEGW